MSDLKRWVGDSLHDVVGYSDSAMAEYLVAAAKKAKSAAGLARTLDSNGMMPTNSKSQAFLQNLYSRASGSSSGAATSKPRASSTVQRSAQVPVVPGLAADPLLTQKYTLLDMDVDTPAPSKREKRKKHTRKTVAVSRDSHRTSYSVVVSVVSLNCRLLRWMMMCPSNARDVNQLKTKRHAEVTLPLNVSVCSYQCALCYMCAFPCMRVVVIAQSWY